MAELRLRMQAGVRGRNGHDKMWLFLISPDSDRLTATWLWMMPRGWKRAS